MKLSSPLRLVVVSLCAYAVMTVLTWNLVKDNMSAQTSCPVPQTMGDLGQPNAGRWGPLQSVTVKLYPGHFTPEEQAEIRNVLGEFENEGRTHFCCQVSFTEVVEEEFPITSNGVGNTGEGDVYYIYRKPISEMPHDAGVTGGARPSLLIITNGNAHRQQ